MRGQIGDRLREREPSKILTGTTGALAANYGMPITFIASFGSPFSHSPPVNIEHWTATVPASVLLLPPHLGPSPLCRLLPSRPVIALIAVTSAFFYRPCPIVAILVVLVAAALSHTCQ